MNSKISFIFSFSVILLIVLGCGQLTKPVRKEVPEFQISVKELEKELKENRTATINKYLNKTIAVKGRVEAKMEMSIILVSPENVRFPIQCFFDLTERESLQQIQRGKEYTLIGVFTVTDKGRATTLSNCKLS